MIHHPLASRYTEPEMTFDLFVRLMALRRKRLIGIVYCDAGMWYISHSEATSGQPYHQREFVTVRELIALIKDAEESQIQRIGPASECAAEFQERRSA
jgi:hypothetical protein